MYLYHIYNIYDEHLKIPRLKAAIKSLINESSHTQEYSSKILKAVCHIPCKFFTKKICLCIIFQDWIAKYVYICQINSMLSCISL